MPYLPSVNNCPTTRNVGVGKINSEVVCPGHLQLSLAPLCLHFWVVSGLGSNTARLTLMIQLRRETRKEGGRGLNLILAQNPLGCLWAGKSWGVFSETSSHFSRPWHSLLLQNSPGCRMLSPLHWGAQSQAGVLLTWWPGGCSHMQKKVLWYFKAQGKHWNCIQNSWGSSETGVITPFLYTLGGLQKVHGNMDYDKTIHGFKFFVHHNKLACQVHFSLAFLKYQHTRRKWRSERHSCSRTHCSQVAELGLNLDLQRPNWHHVLLLSVAYFWQRPLAQIKSESSLAKWENNI